MIYIRVKSHWHIHFAFLCKLLDIDVILICNNDLLFENAAHYYNETIAAMVRKCLGYLIDFGAWLNFKIGISSFVNQNQRYNRFN